MKTQAQAVEAFLKGAMIMVLEYRGMKAETITYRDKQTKQAAEFHSLRHTCLTDTGAVVWQERTPVDFKPEKYVSPYKKGDSVLVTVTSMQTNNGVTVISGSGEVLELVKR